MNEIISEVKALRSTISIALIRVNQLEKSRETSLAYTNLEESFMFLGKVLGALGNESSYPKDTEKGVAKDILDSAKADDVSMYVGPAIKVVKDLRLDLQAIISANLWNILFDQFTGRSPFVQHNSKNWMYATTAFMRVVSAKMWLGMDLNRLVLDDTVAEPPSEPVADAPKDDVHDAPKGTTKRDDNVAPKAAKKPATKKASKK